jgi:penicillin amidase
MVVLGQNERIAWGFTNTGPDVQDVYLEQIKSR